MKSMHAAFMLFPLLLACGARTPQPAAPIQPEGLATLTDCTHVYRHMLEATVVQDVDVDLTLTRDQHEAAITLTDQEWTDRGTTARFYHVCSTQMTLSQVDCALNVEHVTDISTCIKAWPRR